MSSDNEKVLLGVIGAPHGIQGDVKIKIFSDDPMGIKNYQPLIGSDHKQYSFKRLRIQKNTVIACFDGISTRNDAEMLKGVKLFVDRENLPETKDEEFYHVDLLGLKVRDQEGAYRGVVINVANFGASDLIEVRPDHGPSFYVPFTKEFVPHISLQDKYVEIIYAEE